MASGTLSNASPPLDFAALLSREYGPASVSLFSLKDRPLTKRSLDSERSEITAKQERVQTHHYSYYGKQVAEELPPKSKEHIDEETARLVLQLVSKTPAYTKHLHQEGSKIVDDSDLLVQGNPRHQDEKKFHAAFHQVELGDWESKIHWKGYEGTTKSIHSESPNAVSPESILQKRRNPFLENLDFGDLISWSGSKGELASKANKLPLILELGVAGQSIARHVLPSYRPVPCIKSDEYQGRIQKEWSAGDITSTAELSKGSLHADKEKMERLIKHRQEKRRQMAKDKTSRVTEAMGTLDVLGSGRGRTITSSLMGPGGTERTGRPSRHVGANASHDTEYVEQLDM